MKAWKSSWKSSKKPKKQRLYVFRAPFHIKSKLVQSHLSKELRKKYGKRSLRIRKGDKVKIMVGDFKNKTGIVEKVNVKESKIYVQGTETVKRDGSKTLVPIHSSNVLIQELKLDDKKRFPQKETKNKMNGGEKFLNEAKG